MQFQPKTEDQLERENMLPEAQYPFTIMEAKEKEDKNGLAFFALKINVHGPNNRDWHVYDNVSPHWMAYKLRHLAFGVGLGAAYESGNLSAGAFQERTGHCEIGIEPAKGRYPAKNTVVDYVMPDIARGASQEAKAADAGQTKEDDDVPF